jgi:dienelactone hydrolase
MAGVVSLLLVAGLLQAGGDIVLPAPSGPRPVGVATRRWTDSSRVDSLSSPPALRIVLARIWYPARPTPGAAPVPYAEHLDAADNEWTALHRRVRTHSHAGVPFADGEARAPVIVFATGRSTGSFDYTALGEELASHGYVVVAVDSPHHSKVVLADGSLAPIRFPAMGPSTYPTGFDSAQAPMNALVSADLRFVLRRLGAVDRDDPVLRRRLDLARVGMAGHSNGGMAGSRACALEPMCRAFFAIEGMQTRELRLGGVDKPYGLLYSEQTLAFDTLRVFTEMRLHARAPFMLYRVAGVGHNSVTDLPIVRPTQFTYQIDPKRGLDITRSLTRDFFDVHVSGKAARVRIADSFPEVKTERYGPDQAPRPSPPE